MLGRLRREAEDELVSSECKGFVAYVSQYIGSHGACLSADQIVHFDEKRQQDRECNEMVSSGSGILRVALQVLLLPGPPMWPMWDWRAANPRQVRAMYAQASRKVGCHLWPGGRGANLGRAPYC